MLDNANINWMALSDPAIVKTIGGFIKHHRLEQNKTQEQLAKESGLNRWTLVQFEKGKRTNLITLIQLLRALKLLDVLEPFKINSRISPIQLAELELKKRRRAGRTKKSPRKSKSDW